VYTGLKPSDLGLKCVVGWVGVVCLHALHGVKLTVQSAGTKKKIYFTLRRGRLIVVDFSVGWNENGTEKMGSYFAKLCCWRHIGDMSF
jgi:hypothetical protein